MSRGQEAVHGAEGREGAPQGARERQHDVGRARHQPEDGGALPLAQGVGQDAAHHIRGTSINDVCTERGVAREVAWI